ncbi:MAG: HAD family phosphatase [Bacteroidales bacterium]|nr:HAD family phosphatase [Bacteroidales bacterium]
MNLILDYGNVLVRWEPERVYTQFFGSEAQSWYFLRHVLTSELRSRIDAGLNQDLCLSQLKSQYPDQADAIELYRSRWDEMLPGEVPGMRHLVAELRQVPGLQLFGLTNWSMETFPAARRRFEVLQMIDRYVVSGDVGLVKPDPAIFRLILQRYNLEPAETIFVDDNADNVAAATALGLLGVRFTTADELRQKLATLLPPNSLKNRGEEGLKRG